MNSCTHTDLYCVASIGELHGFADDGGANRRGGDWAYGMPRNSLTRTGLESIAVPFVPFPDATYCVASPTGVARGIDRAVPTTTPASSVTVGFGAEAAAADKWSQERPTRGPKTIALSIILAAVERTLRRKKSRRGAEAQNIENKPRSGVQEIALAHAIPTLLSPCEQSTDHPRASSRDWQSAEGGEVPLGRSSSSGNWPRR